MNASEQKVPSSASNHSEVVEWLTAEEVARHLKVKTRTLLLWVTEGKAKRTTTRSS
jgi:hypothetical protein